MKQTALLFLHWVLCPLQFSLGKPTVHAKDWPWSKSEVWKIRTRFPIESDTLLVSLILSYSLRGQSVKLRCILCRAYAGLLLWPVLFSSPKKQNTTQRNATHKMCPHCVCAHKMFTLRGKTVSRYFRIIILACHLCGHQSAVEKPDLWLTSQTSASEFPP